MRCQSCKNKNTTDQCSSHSLKGFLFCGKHLKVKNKRLWTDVSPNRNNAVCIQKIWRGYFVRKLIKYGGKGCLKRSVCHNDEELVTFDSKTKTHPFSYFSLNESGKVYWFDVCTINQWIRTSSTNPYTRQSLDLADRSRLREMCRMRRRLHIANLHTSDHSLSGKWKEICQIIEENGFFDMNHLFFDGLSRNQLRDFLGIIMQDFIAYSSGHPIASRRHIYLQWIKLRLESFNKYPHTISEKIANTLLIILYDCVNNYDICYIIVSARCRL